MTQYLDAQKAAADSLLALSNKAFQGVEQLTALNLQTCKTLLSESAALSQAALSAKTPEEFFKLNVAAVQATPEKLAAYGRQVKDIVTAATAEQRAAAEAKLADVQAKFLDAVNGALKNAPGSEKTLALVKSAVAAANSAYEGVDKAGKQFAGVIEANIAKIGTTTPAKRSSKAVATLDA